ncbi:hypothetical protein HII31_00214 [Pseudocercospora fuligena]|uniref:Uncharacterized protein n=1 Tax=Pseudocercospora fuligena TaxID=685502 RepID=A0A8H6VNM0_9PEZI|nr:hypothetical protein HII31_00214 [Pseudocercospora fuligena]
MTFSFFHLPREVRDRIYCNLRIAGALSFGRNDGDEDEAIKAAIDIKPSTSLLLVSKRFKNEYIATVFSGATVTFGPTSSIHPPKAPVLPNLILDTVTKCKVDLFIPYEAHKVQKEVQLNTICDPDVFLDLPIEEGERLDGILDFDDESYEEAGDVADPSDSEIEWKDSAEELSFSDGEEELENLDEEDKILAPEWLFRLLSKLRALQSVELIVTSGKPTHLSQSNDPADALQLITAEMQGLLQVPLLSKLEARGVVVEDYGFHDTKFSGVRRCGIWTAAFGWKIPEQLGVIKGSDQELLLNECPGWRCGDPTCLGAGNKYPSPRKWFKTPQEVEKVAGKK